MMKEKAIAHKFDFETGQKAKEQPLEDHLERVARLTEQFCRRFAPDGADTDIGRYAYMTGLAHDIGKYAEKFQKKIREDATISVDHSTAGAKELFEKRMLAASFAVAGHHGGMPNGMDTSDSNLKARVNRRKLEDYTAFRDEIALEKIGEPKLTGFAHAFFTRMLFSALTDADFLDTEHFMRQGGVMRDGYDPVEALYERLLAYVAPWRKNTERASLNGVRTGILEDCIKAGSGKQGLYTLTVPTGGGKTVSSLAFALRHACERKLDRVIYVIPYTSIIEQNAAVFRHILGDKNVVEHHSNVSLDETELHQLSAENWDAPLIITTAVQFFESLYSSRVSVCRKLHNIANSVVIFDEAQMMPLPYLKPCVEAIRALVTGYHVTAVLCTATQPALERLFAPLPVTEICGDYEALFQKLRRVQYINYGNAAPEEMAGRVQAARQALVIVNRRKTAQELYRILPAEGTFHLSTYMTPKDRRQAIVQIKERLKAGEICRVVATSLVEAGVDLDFPVVYREKAGLDSIIQAGGRCNREGNRSPEESFVYVFGLQEKYRAFEKNISILEETLEKYGAYDMPDAVRYYFQTLQGLDAAYLDSKNIIAGFEREMDGVVMPFRKADEAFRLIDDKNRKTVFVPTDKEGEQLLDALDACVRERENFRYIMRKLNAYAVDIYETEYEKLLRNGSIYEVADGIAVLQDMRLYERKTGLCGSESGACWFL